MVNIKELVIKNNISMLETPNVNSNIEVIEIEPNNIVKTAEILKGNAFDLLISITAVDRNPIIEMVYHFYSVKTNQKLVIKANLSSQNPTITSLSELYKTADWQEREVFDLFGVKFLKHPNLKRILLPQSWIGYPLRKDYEMKDERLIWNER